MRDILNGTVPVGNTSLAGCVKYGINEKDDTGIEAILKAAGEVILSNESDFPDLYYEHMLFG